MISIIKSRRLNDVQGLKGEEGGGLEDRFTSSCSTAGWTGYFSAVE